MNLALTSAATGDFKITLTGLPAGWVQGWTLFSLDTARNASFGHFLGIEPDALFAGTLTSPAAVGNPFHFTPTGSSVYPNVPYVFFPPLAAALTGYTFDAVAIATDATGNVVGASNVSRVKVQ